MLRTFFFSCGLITSAAVFAPDRDAVPEPAGQIQMPEAAASALSTTGQPEINLLPVVGDLQGISRPSRLAELPSLVPGVIKTVLVREGQYVRAGDPLMTLDDGVPRARLQSAMVEANLTGALQRSQVQLRTAESRLARVQEAVSRNAGAEFEVLAAEAERDEAEASVLQQHDILKAAAAEQQLAMAQLKQYTITAPFDGLVTQVHRKSGAVDSSQIVVTVANLDELEVAMYIPISKFGSIRVGESVRLRAGRPVEKHLQAKVLSVSPLIDSASNTFRCLLRIDNLPEQLPSGFSVMLDDAGINQRLASARK